ncbi:putative cell wall lysis protein [Staphylococcus aureus]|uniref:Putative cell wall lysis protein n=1 Tax=Staphylococcus aureus TaxID=1280 RepID=A0A8G2I1K3_STAAU|nr:putative cell wall lysis protein [Staphylococcus aureus]SUL38266.1 putative cell wall lysis protein [Staphylococcus aureus]
MVNKKDIAKKVIGKTPIGVKLKLAKVIIILCVVAFFYISSNCNVFVSA